MLVYCYVCAARRAVLFGSLFCSFFSRRVKGTQTHRASLRPRRVVEVLLAVEAALLPRAEALLAAAAASAFVVDSLASEIDAQGRLRYRQAVLCLGAPPRGGEAEAAGDFGAASDSSPRGASGAFTPALCVFFPVHRAAAALSAAPADALTPTKDASGAYAPVGTRTPMAAARVPAGQNAAAVGVATIGFDWAAARLRVRVAQCGAATDRALGTLLQGAIDSGGGLDEVMRSLLGNDPPGIGADMALRAALGVAGALGALAPATPMDAALQGGGDAALALRSLASRPKGGVREEAARFDALLSRLGMKGAQSLAAGLAAGGAAAFACSRYASYSAAFADLVSDTAEEAAAAEAEAMRAASETVTALGGVEEDASPSAIASPEAARSLLQAERVPEVAAPALEPGRILDSGGGSAASSARLVSARAGTSATAAATPVPRLSLPSGAPEGGSAGPLTRSTRRTMSSSRRRGEQPKGALAAAVASGAGMSLRTPSFLTTKREPAKAELARLARALGRARAAGALAAVAASRGDAEGVEGAAVATGGGKAAAPGGGAAGGGSDGGGGVKHAAAPANEAVGAAAVWRRVCSSPVYATKCTLLRLIAALVRAMPDSAVPDQLSFLPTLACMVMADWRMLHAHVALSAAAAELCAATGAVLAAYPREAPGIPELASLGLLAAPTSSLAAPPSAVVGAAVVTHVQRLLTRALGMGVSSRRGKDGGRTLASLLSTLSLLAEALRGSVGGAEREELARATLGRCGELLQRARRLLSDMAESNVSGDPVIGQVSACLVAIYASVISALPGAAAELYPLLVGTETNFAWLRDWAELVLSERGGKALGTGAGASLDRARCDALALLAALVRVAAAEASREDIAGTPSATPRAQPAVLWAFVGASPTAPRPGLATLVCANRSLPAKARAHALALLRSAVVLGALDADACRYWAQDHFVRLAQLYLGADAAKHAYECIASASVLITLARRSPAARQALRHVRCVDFLVAEMSAELECAPGAPPVAALHVPPTPVSAGLPELSLPPTTLDRDGLDSDGSGCELWTPTPRSERLVIGKTATAVRPAPPPIGARGLSPPPSPPVTVALSPPPSPPQTPNGEATGLLESLWMQDDADPFLADDATLYHTPSFGAAKLMSPTQASVHGHALQRVPQFLPRQEQLAQVDAPQAGASAEEDFDEGDMKTVVKMQSVFRMRAAKKRVDALRAERASIDTVEDGGDMPRVEESGPSMQTLSATKIAEELLAGAVHEAAMAATEEREADVGAPPAEGTVEGSDDDPGGDSDCELYAETPRKERQTVGVSAVKPPALTMSAAAKRREASPPPPPRSPVAPAVDSLPEPASGQQYDATRSARLLYGAPALHRALLELLLLLLTSDDPSGGGSGTRLCPWYSSQLPLENGHPNAPLVLFYHLAHPANECARKAAAAAADALGSPASRLVRLCEAGSFRVHEYGRLSRLWRGEKSSVFCAERRPAGAAGAPDDANWVGEEVAMKVIEMPRSLHDPCACHDVYGEVGVLQHLAATGDAAAASTCRLLDFGVGSDAYYITMPLYRASLRQWRVRHGELNSAVPLARRLPLYMRIYEATLAAVAAVSAAGVVHFDLKCDNILLEAREGSLDSLFWDPPLGHGPPPFRCVVGDFGEAVLCGRGSGDGIELERGVTTRNRGTEFIKAPEMLLVEEAARTEASSYDRRRAGGAGRPADVWSAACMLYELVAGEFLFFEDDWTRFFARAATGALPVLEARHRERLGGASVGAPLAGLLERALVREPQRRPALAELQARFAQARREVLEAIAKGSAGDVLAL